MSKMTIVVPPQLDAAVAASFRDHVRSLVQPDLKVLELDLSTTQFMDSSGLGVLLALHKTLQAQKGRVILVNPGLQVVQLLELTRLHKIIEVDQRFREA